MTGKTRKGINQQLRDQHKQDAKEIIQALRKGLDYSRIEAMAIVLLEMIEDNCEKGNWSDADKYSTELQRLMEGLGTKYISDEDRAYLRGLAQTSRGILSLCQGEFNQATDHFYDAQRLFRDAGALHSEGVTLFAQGIVHHRKNQAPGTPVKRDWSPALRTLQSSLAIFRELEDELHLQVRRRLGEVNSLLQQDLQNSRLFKSPQVPRSSRDTAKGEPIPVVARIAAGQAILAEENIEGYIVVDTAIAEKVTFGLRVKGYSMIKAGILDGDLVLIEQRIDEPPRGQIAAVIVSQMDVEATLKRFYHEEDHVRLGPANDDSPILAVIPDSLLEEAIRSRYEKSHPGRELIVYSGTEPQIAGWARALIREQVGRIKG